MARDKLLRKCPTRKSSHHAALRMAHSLTLHPMPGSIQPGSTSEALIYSDFVAIPRCSVKIVPYLSGIGCVSIFPSRLVLPRTRNKSELPLINDGLKGTHMNQTSRNIILVAACGVLNAVSLGATAAQNQPGNGNLLWVCGETLLPCRSGLVTPDRPAYTRAITTLPLRASYRPVFPFAKTKR